MTLNKNTALLLELAAIISIQCGASAAKYLFAALGPAVTAVLRVGLAGILLSCIFRPKIRQYTAEQWRCLLFYGVSTGAMNFLFYCGIQRVPLGIGVALEFIGPLTLALVVSRKWTDFLWAVLAAVGIALLVPWKLGEGSLDPLGVIFVFLAGVCWALYILAGEHIAGKVASTDAAACGMWIATILILPFAGISGEWLHLNWSLLGIGLVVAIFSSALPFTLELIVFKKISSKTFSILTSLDPAFAALSGLIFLKEHLTLLQWGAMACIMIASMGTAICAPEKK